MLFQRQYPHISLDRICKHISLDRICNSTINSCTTFAILLYFQHVILIYTFTYSDNNAILLEEICKLVLIYIDLDTVIAFVVEKVIR